jgi:outer membrane protein assembly factor BamA
MGLQDVGGPTTLAAWIGGTDSLRGYRAESLFGNGFLLGNAELRFPISRPELGRTTWPIFLRRMTGALFLDAGDAFDLGGSPEVRSHALALDTVRLGVGGRPVSDPAAATQLYVTVGPVF